MAEKKHRSQRGIQVRKEDDFSDLPKPNDPTPIMSVFSLRLEDRTVALIDQARDVYAKRVAAAVGRSEPVPRESRSAMIRMLIEDGLRSLLGLRSLRVGEKKGGRR